ncbi:13433_t:CDS:10 [Ambispora leptoticha]|uniref:13433_t:CDS:1 n=1 Tax=Ambispora leptoticha TaxID=144679 RepID=A0A9N8ZJH1_9GLOM|nr:13433_t:CDS:10 [Ambispora leptoticha]
MIHRSRLPKFPDDLEVLPQEKNNNDFQSRRLPLTTIITSAGGIRRRVSQHGAIQKRAPLPIVQQLHYKKIAEQVAELPKKFSETIQVKKQSALKHMAKNAITEWENMGMPYEENLRSKIFGDVERELAFGFDRLSITNDKEHAEPKASSWKTQKPKTLTSSMNGSNKRKRVTFNFDSIPPPIPAETVKKTSSEKSSSSLASYNPSISPSLPKKKNGKLSYSSPKFELRPKFKVNTKIPSNHTATPFLPRTSFPQENQQLSSSSLSYPPSVQFTPSKGQQPPSTPTPDFIKRNENIFFYYTSSQESSPSKTPYTPTPKEQQQRRHLRLSPLRSRFGFNLGNLITSLPCKKNSSIPYPPSGPSSPFESLTESKENQVLNNELIEVNNKLPEQSEELIPIPQEDQNASDISSTRDSASEESEDELLLDVEYKSRFFGDLTEDQESRINEIIDESRKEKKVVSQMGPTIIEEKDLDTLQPKRYINGEIISMYARLLNARVLERRSAGDVNQQDVFMTNTYFYTLVEKAKKSGNFKKLEKFLSNNNVPDLFEKDKLLVPVHLGNHWVCAVINLNEKTISVYDSGARFGSGGTQSIGPNLLEFIQGYRVIKKQQSDRDEWKVNLFPSEIPQQPNGYDCGVYTMLFADYISEQREFDFDNLDMSIYRNRIKYEVEQNLPETLQNFLKYEHRPGQARRFLARVGKNFRWPLSMPEFFKGDTFEQIADAELEFDDEIGFNLIYFYNALDVGKFPDSALQFVLKDPKKPVSSFYYMIFMIIWITTKRCLGGEVGWNTSLLLMARGYDAPARQIRASAMFELSIGGKAIGINGFKSKFYSRKVIPYWQ